MEGRIIVQARVRRTHIKINHIEEIHANVHRATIRSWKCFLYYHRYCLHNMNSTTYKQKISIFEDATNGNVYATQGEREIDCFERNGYK